MYNKLHFFNKFAFHHVYCTAAGPALSLYERKYYENMKRALKPNGIVCIQGIVLIDMNTALFQWFLAALCPSALFYAHVTSIIIIIVHSTNNIEVNVYFSNYAANVL